MQECLNSSVKMDWQTPDSLLELVREVGPILLDPCTVESNPVGASFVCTPEHDGLRVSWASLGPGLVYVNPPYGRELPKWVDKCCQEATQGAEIVLLTPARPDTRWFQAAMDPQHWPPWPPNVLLFWRGRLKFKGAPSSAPFPSALWYWGPRHERFCEVFAGKGLFL